MDFGLSFILLYSLAGLVVVAGGLFLLWKGKNKRPESVAREPRASGESLPVEEPPPEIGLGIRPIDEPLSQTGGKRMTYHVYKDAAGQWRWRLIAANNRNVANSGEGYANKQDCLAAIELVKTSGNAPVKED